MIHFGPRPPEPEHFKSPPVKKQKEKIKRKYRKTGEIKSDDFPSRLWRRDDVRKPLYKYQNKKCCYCGRIRTLSREFDVEHFRPKSEVKDEDHSGYWWLAFEWDNYFLACKPCNETYKGSHFPLMPDGVRAQNSSDCLFEENPVFINPEKEDPADFFAYKMDWHNFRVYIFGCDDAGRGDKNRKILGLNDGPMPEERGTIFQQAQDLHLDLCEAIRDKNKRTEEIAKKKIKRLTSRSAPYSGVARYALGQLNISAFLDKPLW